MPYRKGKGEIAEGLEWKTAEWTGEEGGMTAKVSVISGIVSPRDACTAGRAFRYSTPAILRSSAGDEVQSRLPRTNRRKPLSFPSLPLVLRFN